MTLVIAFIGIRPPNNPVDNTLIFEEPLSIRMGGNHCAVITRTPGDGIFIFCGNQRRLLS